MFWVGVVGGGVVGGVGVSGYIVSIVGVGLN